jgi:SAM-dependent methyltransferase
MMRALEAIKRLKAGDMSVLKDEKWLMYLALTPERNVNLERLTSMEEIKHNYVLNYVEKTLQYLEGETDTLELNATELYILEETLKWSETAKAGLPHQRKEWMAKGFNLFVHNIGSAQIYNEHTRDINDTPGNKQIIYDLIYTHGLIGQYIRGEVPLDANEPLYRLACRIGSSSAAADCAQEAIDLKKVLMVLNYCIICSVDERIWADIRNQAEEVICHVLEGRFGEQHDLKERLRRLRAVSIKNGENFDAEYQRVFSDPRATERFETLLCKSELWYVEAALYDFSFEEFVKVFLLADLSLDHKRTRHLSFEYMMKDLYYQHDGKKRVNIYKKRIIEKYLGDNPVEAILAGEIKENPHVLHEVTGGDYQPSVTGGVSVIGDESDAGGVSVIGDESDAGGVSVIGDESDAGGVAVIGDESDAGGVSVTTGGNPVAGSVPDQTANNGTTSFFNFRFSPAGGKLIEFCVEAEKSDVLYESAVVLLFDLFGLRRDKYDRLYEEERYLTTMNQSIDYKKIILDYITGGRILDIGPGGGALMDIIEERFPEKQVLGVDIAENVLDALKKKKQLEGRKWDVVYGDALHLDQYIQKESADTIIYCSILHELYSYIESDGRKFNHDTLACALKSAFEVLFKGGRIIIRDGIMTEPVEQKRIIQFLSEDGMEFLERYAGDFKGRQIQYAVTGHNEVIMPVNDAMEFLYTYTWGEKSYVHEVNEQFGYFTPSGFRDFITGLFGDKARITEFRHFLQDGYSIALSPKIRFFDENRNETRLPDSTCIIVIEKA